ncbi:hypothetical protein SRB5_44970 [Streptomyces sp. RB5]|uniref:Antitoxin SocA-like Panacea domain-containing protein n=2 Tax=Streptomyces smaragdinus TaxID=2585196 RepID=A0A7K0CM45_9ACTN|nr:hypothetical protein [Streptomyces smaragdinus]
MSVLKLQRLCYFAYGYHLAWEHQRLFEEPFEAWANGPVVRELYRQHRGRFQLNIGDIEGSVAALDNGERDSVDIVLETFAPYPTHELSAMSHQTTGPWQHARDRAGAADLERSDEVLLDEEIAHYFDALSDRAG